MQVNQSVQSVNQVYSQPAVTPAANSANTATRSNTAAHADTVTISAQAMALSRNDQSSLPGTLPALPNNGDKVDAYVDYKKAQMQYQVASDLTGIATGTGNGISAPTAYYLNNNDDARSAVVNQQVQQQNLAAMQAYATASDNAQQWYEE
ncbi:hypothetical protein FLM48_15025 [Shewanella sp. Scap07]|uniref:hypothetical protein n=1 Tax=Shewanella sp. Scap07 TaxID=2589987 RepID=UPI0015BE75D3|nr:hypothetical protein [Shewanella sp. Scap07]QLE86268.1 hypothetical protein FLM48_15025 [Shewanella sp. Scap07]